MSVVSFASGCRPPLSRLLRDPLGDGRTGDTCRIDLFGSSAEIELEFASMYELTRDCGPKENEVFSEALGRLGIRGIWGML